MGYLTCLVLHWSQLLGPLQPAINVACGVKSVQMQEGRKMTIFCVLEMLTCSIMALRSSAAAWSLSQSSMAARLAAAACSGVSTG